eukprot:CAMPEP_0171942206 /NCGR_PEP_ID=MMETSP0993-20121228/38486_1 /TAXON_ID=483369 /ORGANISM="non described non described, Strain CCMP2098" /LENGTH=328 /DNA_ID=CAMNT_0012584593 /DNA_START=15 /DNA_END=1001 /DNA_ORIENTATION=-
MTTALQSSTEAKLSAVKMSMSWEDVTLALTSPHNYPIEQRYQALFFAKSCAPSSADFIRVLSEAFVLEKACLMRHEICYVLGQSGEVSVIPLLRQVLHDENENEITRHEAAEALAALDAPELLLDMERYISMKESLPLLADTCELAIEGLRTNNDARMCACQDSVKEKGGKFRSKDPAKGKTNASASDIPTFEKALLDETSSLFARYEAMFTLRDLAASACIARALEADKSSDCLRHELCFVLAQLEDEGTADVLIMKLKDASEHGVVRHEAAIALSAMGDGEGVNAALCEYLKDPDPLVSESCAAALSTVAYWEAWEKEEARVASTR